MSSQRGDELVGIYMARLGAGLAGLPADRRDEIAGEIANHIAEARAQLAHESDADVGALLQRIGDPAEIATAAQEAPGQPAAPARSWGALEIAALILTPFLWPVGVILLWLSPAWRLRDKLIGTLLPPGGYLSVLVIGPAALLGTVSAGGGSCVTESDDTGRVIYHSCTGVAAWPEWVQTVLAVVALVGFALLLVLPVIVAIYLAIQLRRGGNASPQAHNGPARATAAWTDGPATIT